MKYFIILVVILMICIVPVFAEELGVIHFHGGLDPVRSNLTGEYYYSRGDTIKFNGWANAYQDGGRMIKTPNPTFDIKITDPDNHIITHQTITGDKDGHVEFLFPVGGDYKFGQYLVDIHISKDGYYTYTQDPQPFFVVRGVSDEIKSQDHTVKIWPEKSKIRFATAEKLFVSVCPSPLSGIHAEGFIDPETGFHVDDSYFLVDYTITKPDGIKITNAFSSVNSYRCNEALENQIYADTPGKWTISASAKWLKDGVLYYAQSHPTDIIVEDPVFSSTQIERVLDKGYAPLDWSPDGKYMLLKNATEYYMKNNLKLELVNTQDHSITKLVIPINDDNDLYIDTAKFSSNGDGIFFVTADHLHRYDIANKTIRDIEIKNIAGFSLDSLGNVFYSTRKPQSTDERYFIVWKTDLVNTVKVADGPDFSGFDVNDNGTKLLYRKFLEGGYGWQNSVLAVYDIEGKKESTIPKITDADCGSIPQWAPNNNLIIYHISGCGRDWPGGMIKITDMDGNENVLIQPSNNNPANFIVSPDGKYLVYPQSYYDENTKSGLYRMTLARPVPEFDSVSNLILATSLISVIVFSVMKSRKNL
jgi:hypothetical protein